MEFLNFIWNALLIFKGMVSHNVSKFFSKIDWAFYSFKRGIRNVIRWTPVIWHDEDFDGEFLLHILEWKLRKMSKYFTAYGHHVTSDKEAREMLICAEAIKRLRIEDYDGNQIHKRYFKKDFYFKNYDARRKGILDLLLKIFKKSELAWWD